MKENSALSEQVGGNYYKQFKIQPMEMAERLGMSPAHYSAFKYACRIPFKGDVNEQIDKMFHCLQIGVELNCSFEVDKKLLPENYMEDFLNQFGKLHSNIIWLVIYYTDEDLNMLKSYVRFYLDLEFEE